MSRFSSRKVSEGGEAASCCSKSPWLRVRLECSWEVGGREGGKGGRVQELERELGQKSEEKRGEDDKKWAVLEQEIKGRWCVLVLSFTVLLFFLKKRER